MAKLSIIKIGAEDKVSPVLKQNQSRFAGLTSVVRSGLKTVEDSNELLKVAQRTGVSKKIATAIGVIAIAMARLNLALRRSLFRLFISGVQLLVGAFFLLSDGLGDAFKQFKKKIGFADNDINVSQSKKIETIPMRQERNNFQQKEQQKQANNPASHAVLDVNFNHTPPGTSIIPKARGMNLNVGMTYADMHPLH